MIAAPLGLPGLFLLGKATHEIHHKLEGVEGSTSSKVKAAFGAILVQVTLLVVCATVTALILNRELRARGFWRAVFFFPVLLSPVVVGMLSLLAMVMPPSPTTAVNAPRPSSLAPSFSA